MKSLRVSASFLRNFIFGVEDSLVSTVGLLSGVGIAGASSHAVIMTGVVYICVEGFSMAAGSYLAERSAEEYEKRTSVSPLRSMQASFIMFVSFVIAGLVPLLPYLLLDSSKAFITSVVFSLAVLFALGLVSARLSKTNFFSRGLQMALVGGAAILVGVVAGSIVGVG